MEIEFTGRQSKIQTTTQEAAREGIARLARILGPLTAASCILSGERHLKRLEIHLKSRRHQIVAHGASTTQAAALRLALEHAESQAQRLHDRKLDGRQRKRKATEAAAEEATRTPARSNGKAAPRKPTRPALAAIPAGRRIVTEPHLVSAAQAILPDPTTPEQAVKKAESEDRDLLIFRTPEGTQCVLHRQRDGQMAMVALG